MYSHASPSHVDQIAALAGRHAIPTLYSRRAFPMQGGLVSYGPSLRYTYHQAGIYTGRILKGAKPVVLPTKFELVIKPQDRRDARPDSA